ncbi:hypothetical protein CASFOL_010794 [Castilleja foliolosa]|uniref:Uncharacterized protein n=1 Tax=Castilleja foliolosa TaxID=1961234 RepID=A0ABD3DUQ2_9LAMI
MSFTTILALICLLNFQPFLTAQYLVPQQTKLNTYIVHVDVQPEEVKSWYNSILSTNHDLEATSAPRILHNYHNVFSGFAARLSKADLKALRQKSGFISARRERVYNLHTTHSPNFLGLLNQASGFWNISNYGKGVIIGLLDTGITPDHPSFDDKGLSPPPSKWKGECQFESKAVCNNKLIGARYFDSSGSPVDEEGHGTHTASTAAGNFVDGANIFGNANGTATGIAPHAHLAIYRVCGVLGCTESNIVAALDAAIDDGVDILSLSLGGQSDPFHSDSIAIGAYRAAQKGILVSCSAGNSGHTAQTLSNEAPWILTVGASTIDRKIRATATFGTDDVIEGETAFQPKDFPDTKLEVLSAFTFGPFGSSYCDSQLAAVFRGKIVFCETGGLNSRVDKGQVVKDAGGAAMILASNEKLGNTTFAEAHVLPAIHISYSDGLRVKSYLDSNSSPTATISFKGTVIGDGRAPVVAGFSSRGPSLASPGILKPDIIGPGVNILAAWHESVERNNKTKGNFNIISGTSMSCPHLSGVAALLKSAHPDWSPAVIKSAIVTTANQVNLAGNPIEDEKWSPASVFATGAGHVNVSRANDPGLVYDIQPDDYIPYLCGLNYTNKQVSVIVQRNVDCSRVKSIPEAQLNYPSFSISIKSTPETYTRTVTNVGEPKSSYAVEIVAPSGVNVTVKPVNLRFSKVNQKLQYNVTFTGSSSGKGSAQGFISWNSASRSVRSPIAVV